MNKARAIQGGAVGYTGCSPDDCVRIGIPGNHQLQYVGDSEPILR